jgi:hypothetical protein
VASCRSTPAKAGCVPILTEDAVIRADIYLGERYHWGLGFSDNVVFHQQYCVRAVLLPGQPVTMYLHQDEQFRADPSSGQLLAATSAGWQFDVAGTGFSGTFGVELDMVPEDGWPAPYVPQTTTTSEVPA